MKKLFLFVFAIMGIFTLVGCDQQNVTTEEKGIVVYIDNHNTYNFYENHGYLIHEKTSADLELSPFDPHHSLNEVIENSMSIQQTLGSRTYTTDQGNTRTEWFFSSYVVYNENGNYGLYFLPLNR